MPKKATDLNMTQSYPLREAQRPAFRAIWNLVEPRLIQSPRHMEFHRTYSIFTCGIGIKNMPDSRIIDTLNAVRLMRDTWVGWPDEQHLIQSIPGCTFVLDEELEGIAFLRSATDFFMNPSDYFKPWAWATEDEMRAGFHDSDSPPSSYSELFADQVFKHGYERVFFALTVCKWQAETDANKLFPGLRFAFTRAFLALFLSAAQRAELNMTRAERDSIERSKRRAEREAEKARREMAKDERVKATVSDLQKQANEFGLDGIDLPNVNPTNDSPAPKYLLADEEPLETEIESYDERDEFDHPSDETFDNIDALDSDITMDDPPASPPVDSNAMIRDALNRMADAEEIEEFSTNRIPLSADATVPTDNVLESQSLLFTRANPEGMAAKLMTDRLTAMGEMIDMLEQMSSEGLPMTPDDIIFHLNQWIEVEQVLSKFVMAANEEGFQASVDTIALANSAIHGFRNRIVHQLSIFGQLYADAIKESN